jgi:thimet oligopeptidase
MIRHVLSWLLGASLASISAGLLSAQQTRNPPPLYPGPLDSAAVATLVDHNLAAARRSYDAMLAVRDRRTAQNTLRPWDNALNRAWEAEGLAQIALHVHPDSVVRAEGLRAVERVSRFRTEITTDPRAAGAFQAVDTVALSPEERLLTRRALRDFRRAGVLLPEARRAQVRQHLETLDRLSIRFARNIAEDTTTFAVPESKLAGMPPDWLSRHGRDSAGQVVLTLQYPDFFPVLTYAADRDLRRRMWLGFENRGRAANVVVLDSLLRVRETTARLLGYPTWAAYQAEPQMAASVDSIAAFIERVSDAAEPARERLLARLLERLRREGISVDRLAVWDGMYAVELLRQSDYDLESREVRRYFPSNAVKRGVLEVAAQLFAVTIRPARVPVWHPSVEPYEVLENGRLLGRFYLDLHPRPAKYQHAAVFPVRAGIAGRQVPEAMLVTNFPGGDPNDPGLMELGDVITFFHEFGHLMHHMFARQPYATLQWPDERDFVEAPSQMLEEFVRLPQVLARLSRHVESGRPIPDSLVTRMRAADALSRPRSAAVNAGLAAVSLELHRAPAGSVDVDSLTHRKLTEYTGLVYPDPTHFATAFDHLGSGGYAAAYYTYLWSQVISKDLWSKFDPARPFDPGPARRYRDIVLRRGGGKSSARLVHEFLGRPFGFESWRRWLEGGLIPEGTPAAGATKGET